MSFNTWHVLIHFIGRGINTKQNKTNKQTKMIVDLPLLVHTVSIPEHQIMEYPCQSAALIIPSDSGLNENSSTESRKLKEEAKRIYI